MSNSITPAPRIRRLRFGLRAGLGTIAVFAVLFALLDYWLRAPYRAEQRAAAALVQLGGKVLLVEHTQGWIRKYAGLNIFDMRVAAMIDLSHSRITDADLVHLRAFHHFGQIDLSDTEISNSKLDLSGTNVTDAGLDSLLGLEELKTLGLSRTKVTPEGVARLKARWKGPGPLSITTGNARVPIITYAPIPK